MTLDILRDFVENNIESYLAVIRTETEEGLPSFASVEIGNDYEKSGKKKPFILMDPAQIAPDQEGYGVISGVYSIDILIAVSGYDGTTVSKHTMRYADAVTQMFFDHDDLDEQVTDVTVEKVEYFPGGSGNEKYALITLQVKRETNRG